MQRRGKAIGFVDTSVIKILKYRSNRRFRDLVTLKHSNNAANLSILVYEYLKGAQVVLFLIFRVFPYCRCHPPFLIRQWLCPHHDAARHQGLKQSLSLKKVATDTAAINCEKSSWLLTHLHRLET